MLIEPLLSLSIAANNWSSGDCADDELLLLDDDEMPEMPDVADELALLESEPEICCKLISSDMISWLKEPPVEPDDDWSCWPGGGGGGADSVCVVNADDPVEVEDDVAEDEPLALDCIILSNEKMSDDDPTLPTVMMYS